MIPTLNLASLTPWTALSLMIFGGVLGGVWFIESTVLLLTVLIVSISLSGVLDLQLFERMGIIITANDLSFWSTLQLIGLTVLFMVLSLVLLGVIDWMASLPSTIRQRLRKA